MASGWHRCAISVLGQSLGVVDLPNAIPCPANLVDEGPDTGAFPVTYNGPLQGRGPLALLPTQAQGAATPPAASQQKSWLTSLQGLLAWFANSSNWKHLGILVAGGVLIVVGLIAFATTTDIKSAEKEALLA